MNNTIALSGVLSVALSEAQKEYKKAYFAGGCFWCMEESFDKVN
jgi:peptide-methionine (S)-S-oxide reductase